MRILIAFDGSECSEAAVEDLTNAGLRGAADVAVLSVAQRPAPSTFYSAMPGCGGSCESSGGIGAGREYDLYEARVLADQAADRLRAAFPHWHIESEAWVDASESIGSDSSVEQRQHGTGAVLAGNGSAGRPIHCKNPR